MLWGVVALLFVGAAAVAVYKVYPLLEPESVESAALDPECDLRAGPCVTKLSGGGTIALALTPRDIPLLKPLQVEVLVEGIEADAASVDFKGVDMNMGFNRPQLTAVGPGRFTGTAVLPVCVRNAMEWQATVLVESSRGLLAAPFRFITVKP